MSFHSVFISHLKKSGNDVYIIGSNAHLLSGDLATMLFGRYIKINMLPLSFKEYFEIKGADTMSKSSI